MYPAEPIARILNMTKRIITMPIYNSDILKHIPTGNSTLVLMDLDDVILTPHQYACGSIWYHNHREANKHIKERHHILGDFYYCARNIEHKALSSQLVANFSNLSESVTVLGFTARSEELASETLRDVKNAGMKFSTKLQHEDYPNLKDGVIFVGASNSTAKPGNKGTALLTFLSKDILPEVDNVFFIDDNLQHVQEVYNALQDMSLTVVHYTEAHARLHCDFTQEELNIIGPLQFESLKTSGYIPGNEEALFTYYNNTLFL